MNRSLTALTLGTLALSWGCHGRSLERGMSPQAPVSCDTVAASEVGGTEEYTEPFDDVVEACYSFCFFDRLHDRRDNA